MPDNDMNKSIETNNSGLNNAESSSPQGMAKTDQSSKPEQKAEKSTAGNTQNLPDRVNLKASLTDLEIQGIKSDIQELKKENRELKTEVENLKKSLETAEINKRILSLSEEILDLQKEKKQLETAKSEAEQNEKELKKQLETAKSEAEQNEKELKKQLETAKNEAEQNEKELKKQLETANFQSEEKINALTEEVDSFKPTLEEFQSSTASYIKLMKALYSCDSMQKYLTDKGLPETFNESPKTVITFIAVAGGGYILASDIVRYMGQYKQNHHDPITPEEKILIDAVNLFYQEKYDLPETECVLYIPKGMETFSGFKVQFKKQEMQDINKAIGNFQNAVALYVPAYHEPNSTIFKAKAIVEGK